MMLLCGEYCRVPFLRPKNFVNSAKSLWNLFSQNNILVVGACCYSLKYIAMTLDELHTEA